MKKVQYRSGNKDDLFQLQKLFVESILNICSKDYTEAQIKKWASGSKDEKRWEEIISQQLVIVAESNQSIIGFGTLDRQNCIDLLYVSSKYLRLGIAKQICLRLEKDAIDRDVKKLVSHVSITARPFFESLGFDLVRENLIKRDDVEFKNYTFEKNL
ncbi:GNAT family N-acetyltransferase [Leptospira kemamanensis]|uniref:GNAT family N-acetyltransferase n=1 Tax=Leptospira kemamanensis TaxID=2484942 RepID=A0A4R9JRU5_9LEPT|nr:GNAT family N-acetyltransferase [Leptospira kemamanensis]TGL54381.1 GNAT family N-acetyltransferase [Leptospira kemamanensis]